MKHIKTVIVFLLIFFVGQWLIAFSFDWISSKSSFRFSKMYSGSQKMDNEILCIGNSRGVNSFYSPHLNDKYSLKAFNLSYNSMDLAMQNLLIEDYLKRHESPKTVFIEVTNVFNSDPNFSSFKLYSNKSEKLSEEIKTEDCKTSVISSIFPLYRFNTELFYRSLFYLGRSDQNWVNRYEISKKLESEILELDAFSFDVKQNNLTILKQTVETLNEKDIEVILFVAPYHPSYLTKIENLKDLIGLIEKTTGSSVEDLSDFLNESKYFADRIHTNEKGAISITDALIKLSNQN